MTGVSEDISTQQQVSRCNDDGCDHKISSMVKCFLNRHPKYKLAMVMKHLLAFAILAIPYCISYYDELVAVTFLLIAVILIIIGCVSVFLSLLYPIANGQQIKGTGAGCFAIAIILLCFSAAYDGEYCSSGSNNEISNCKAGSAMFNIALIAQVFYVLVYVLICKGNEVIRRWFPVSIRIGLLFFINNAYFIGFIFIYGIYQAYHVTLGLYIAYTTMTYICVIVSRHCDCCGVCISNVWFMNIFVVAWIAVSIATFVEWVTDAWYVVDGSTTAWIYVLGFILLAIEVQYWMMFEILAGADTDSNSDAAYEVIADDRDDRKEEVEVV